MADAIVEISQETIEKVKTEIEKLEEQAIQDLIFHEDNLLSDFDRSQKIFLWYKRSNRWKYLLHAQTEATNSVKNRRYYHYKNDVLAFNLTDKELQMKLEADAVYSSYKTYLFYIDIAVRLIEKVMSLLDSQRYDLKDKIGYIKFLEGES